jgi:plasmid stabilization system protein ParE
MKLPNILSAARNELAEAVDWYESRSPGLGIEFVGAVDVALHAIGEQPERFPVWGANRRYRFLVLDRFPYLVFFHLREQGAEVVAIAHAKRRPGYWVGRIGP